MKNILIFTLFLLSFSLYANPQNDTTATKKLTGEIYFDKKGFKGEQFYNKEWQNGDIELSTGETIYNSKLKYSILQDEVIWFNENINQQIQLDKPLIIGFVLKNNGGTVTHFVQIQSTNPFFAEIAAEGSYSLYIQRRVKITNEDVNIDGGNYRLQKITPAPLYHIKTESGKLFSTDKISKSALFKALPEQKEQIMQIIKSNHLKLKKEKDVIRLIQLLNENK